MSTLLGRCQRRVGSGTTRLYGIKFNCKYLKRRRHAVVKFSTYIACNRDIKESIFIFLPSSLLLLNVENEDYNFGVLWEVFMTKNTTATSLTDVKEIQKEFYLCARVYGCRVVNSTQTYNNNHFLYPSSSTYQLVIMIERMFYAWLDLWCTLVKIYLFKLTL